MSKRFVLTPPNEPRSLPCLCVSCKCGAVFMGCIVSAGLWSGDKELMKEIEQYARDGYNIDVRNAKDFKLSDCVCEPTIISDNDQTA